MNSGRDGALYYILIGVSLVFILLSNPFLKIPYDPLDHLMRIASLHDEGTCFVFWPEDIRLRYFWHHMWADLFKISGINDFFVWAKIIHAFQFLLAFGAVIYFSRTAIRLLLNAKETIHVKFLSFFSVVFWFIGNGTFSIAYQQAWIMWYSVTYQGLTIPLFWYVTALTLKLFFEDTTDKKKVFFVLQIAATSFIIAKAHSMELLYYFVNLVIILLISMKRLLGLKHKKVLLLYIPLGVCMLLFMTVVVRYSMPEQVPFLKLLSAHETIGQTFQKINTLGHDIISQKLSRFPDSFSEATLISLISAVMFRIYCFFQKGNSFSLNRGIFDYLLVSSLLFSLIPVVPFLAGLGGYLTNEGVIYRFFFASPWFVFLPFLTYTLLTRINNRISLYKVIFANALIIILIILSSHYLLFNTVYGNVKSIIISLDRDKVGVQYSKDDIDVLREIIMSHDGQNKGKPDIYYIRGDLAYLVRGIFRKYAYAGRLSHLPKQSFFDSGLDKKYNLIDVALPENFPKDPEIFRYFPLEKM